jgi:hypothetical protein
MIHKDATFQQVDYDVFPFVLLGQMETWLTQKSTTSGENMHIPFHSSQNSGVLK